MCKSKAKLIAMIFMILIFSILFITNTFAGLRNSIEESEWKIAITSDTKDLNDTREIKFKVEENDNVAKGKIAPGVKAVAKAEIDLTGTKVPVEIMVLVDTLNKYSGMKLTAKLDGENYTIGTSKVIELENNSMFTKENGKKVLELELEWIGGENNNQYDTEIGMYEDTIEFPITINVSQHISDKIFQI